MIDKEKVERAAALLLEGLGEDVGREGLRETPKRIARSIWRRRLKPRAMGLYWRRILCSIRFVNTICCPFLGKHILHTFRMGRW